MNRNRTNTSLYSLLRKPVYTETEEPLLMPTIQPKYERDDMSRSEKWDKAIVESTRESMKRIVREKRAAQALDNQVPLRFSYGIGFYVGLGVGLGIGFAIRNILYYK